MLEKLITSSGHRLTKPRRLVLGALEIIDHPISAQALHESLNKEIDLVSVYRTLNLLESLSVVHKERFKNEEMYYLSRKPHHHIFCRKCGAARSIPCDHLFLRVKGYKEIEHSLNITGICKKCFNSSKSR